MTRGILRYLALIAAALALSACTRLLYLNAAAAYSQAIPLLTWEIDGYVDLTGAQKAWVRERLARAMQWHRASELPEYRRFLESVARSADAPFTEAQVAAAYAQLREDYHRVVEHELGDIADFLVQLDPAQIARLERRFAEDNARMVKESTKGTPEERRARSAKRMVGHIEEWTGALSSAQRGIVAARVYSFPAMLDERIADWRYRQMETVALARARDRARAIAGVRRLLVDTDAWRRPEYRRKLGERDAAAFRMIAELSATLTPGQRARLRERVAGYVRDITRLAAGT